MDLLFIHGMPGVGKLTVAREVAARTGHRLFHNHLTVDLVTAVFEFGSAPFIQLREQIWLDVFARAADAGLPGLIFTFAFEPTVGDDFIAQTLETIETGGGRVLFAELRCDQRELEARLVQPSRQRFGKLRSLELLHSLQQTGGLQTPPLPRPNFIVDITRLEPAVTAELICTHYALDDSGAAGR